MSAARERDLINPRAEEAAAWWLRLYGDTTGWLTLFSADKSVRWFNLGLNGSIEDAAEYAIETAETQDVWYGVGLRKNRGNSGRGTSADVSVVPGFWFDIDVGKEHTPATNREALHLIETFPLQPSCVVASGGGLHPYYLFPEPFVIETEEEHRELAMLSKGWGQALQRIAEKAGYQFDTVSDLARVMRIPGTANWKTGNRRPVSLADKSTRTYSLADFDRFIPEQIEEAPTAGTEGTNGLSDAATMQILTACKSVWRDGKRHDVVKALSGWLANNGINEAAAVELIRRGSATYGDQDPDTKQKTVRDTYAKLRAGVRPMGWNSLKQLLAPSDLKELDRILRPIIVLHKQEHRPAENRSADAGGYHLSDLGNAKRLVAAHGEDVRYCKAFGKWFVWDGRRWADDETDEIVRRAKHTVGAIYGEAANALDDDERKTLAKHALKSESEQRIHAMIGLAESEPSIPLLSKQLDLDPWLLTVNNGTIDLRTGKLREHRRDDLITKFAPVTFDPTATCPRWTAFLESVFAGDTEVIGFMKRALGYSLTGSTRERVLFILHGVGRNGKGTLLEVIRSILGADYSSDTPTDTLLVKRDSGIPNDVAKLRGTRFVTASEVDEGRRLAEATVKKLTGGDTVSARFMRGEFFDFMPAFKLWLGTNHKPDIRGTDRGIWDRLRTIPFNVRFVKPEEEPDAPAHLHADPQLREKLLEEAPGILAWMVQGCIDWQKYGLGYPKAVKDATAGYRAEMDVIGNFITDCCIESDGASVTAKELYAAYTQWCDNTGERPLTQTMVGKRLTERGFDSAQIGKNRARTWIGLGLQVVSNEVPF